MRDNACEKCMIMRKKCATLDVCLKGNAERGNINLNKRNSVITSDLPLGRGVTYLKRIHLTLKMRDDEPFIEDLNRSFAGTFSSRKVYFSCTFSRIGDSNHHQNTQGEQWSSEDHPGS